jgi:mono/diheme cytochrome c family protein
MKTLCGWTLVAMAVATLAACGDNKDKPAGDAAVDSPPADPVARGEYIVNVLGACSFCHTPLLPNGSRDLDRLLAGVDCFIDFDSPDFTDNENGHGCLSTRNLTPDATGLANATDEQIKNAFQNGMRTDGKKLTPIMPWYIFHNMTDDDADAVVAYLRSVPPVEHQVKANEDPASLYNDGAPIWDVVPLLDNQIPMPRGGANNAAAMHGRYLASSVGLCIDCHTPEVSFGAIRLDMDKAFAGGKVFPKGTLGLIDSSYPANIATRNLTTDPTGLGGWTKDQIEAAIALGKDRDGKAVCAATHGAIVSPYAGLTDSDLSDIAEYLMALPAIENDTANDPAAANCGAPPFPLDAPVPEDEADCGNGSDDDGDLVPDDGCPVACGNCQGPTVP